MKTTVLGILLVGGSCTLPAPQHPADRFATHSSGHAAAGTVAGIVLNFENQPVPGVTVVLAANGKPDQTVAITDLDGVITMANVADGPATISLYYGDHEFNQAITVPVDGLQFTIDDSPGPEIMAL